MVGTKAGKYQIIEVIGRGSMGTVYRAQDTTLHRDVAIKVLNTDVADPAAAKRFRAEAVVVARLNHPRIAKVYDLIEHDGQLLMAMELVSGETLDSLVDRTGPLPAEKAAAFMSQALDALAHAHEMGVIHRDLKPANLMVADGRVKVTDFGIARVAGAEHLTSVGFLMGTPAYMAPEQLLGREVDARTDVFAVGCVLYFLVTGKLPFKGETAMEIVEARLHDEPTPVRMFRSELPEWFAQVVSRSLTRDPAARFQTATEFRDAIERGLAGLPVLLSAPKVASADPGETMMPGAVRVPPPVPLPVPAPVPVSAPVPGPVSGMASPDRPAANASGGFAETILTPLAAVPPIGPSGTSGTSGLVGPGPVRVGPVGPGAAAGKPKAPFAAIRPQFIAGAAAVLVVVVGVVWSLWPRGTTPPPATEVTQQAEPSPQTQAPPTDPIAATGGSAAATGTVAAGSPVATGTPSVPAATGVPVVTSAPKLVTPSTSSAPGTTVGPAGRGRKEAEVPLSFGDVKLLKITGKRGEDVDATLIFGGGAISITPRGDAPNQLRPYDMLLAATFVKDRDPRWASNLSAPPSDLDLPASLFTLRRRSVRNWLVLQGQTFHIVLSLTDEDSPRVLAALAERTRVKIDQPGK